MKIEIINDNEVKINDASYFLYKNARAIAKKNKFKDVFDCQNINDLFAFASKETVAEFKVKLAYKNLSEKKMAQELIERGIEIINEGWKPTLEDIWYYPSFKRTPSGLSFGSVGCCDVGNYADVPASLAIKSEQTAKHAGIILLPEYSIYMKP